MSNSKPVSPDEQLVDSHVTALLEHFDSVEIFVTRHVEHDNTLNLSRGGGNWYTRFGQISEWLVKEKQFAREEIYCDCPDEGEDDDDSP